MEAYNQFQRYTWINAEVVVDQSDPRIESHKINVSSIEIIEHVPTSKDWGKRRHFILNDAKVQTNLQYIKDMAKEDKMSLCTFKPTKFLEVKIIPNNKQELTKQEQLEFLNANRNLFDDQLEFTTKEFENMPHIPYSFKIMFEDEVGETSNLSVIDWEIPQLYLSCRSRGDSESTSAQKVKEKLEGFISEKDLYLFLGTMKMSHIRRAKNPYTIIGLFYPPKVKSYQATLF